MGLSHRVVVTGLGPLSAAGLGADRLAAALALGAGLFSPIERFAPGAGEPKVAAQVDGFEPADWMSPALVRQTDRSTHFALASARTAIDDAGLELAKEDPMRLGIMMSNAVGGMVFAEPELYNQWVLGPDQVGVYQAIAWFYAAAMGQLSIALGIKGYSKTFVADRASGQHAIGHAYRALQWGKLDVCLAGGTEAPLMPFMYRCIAGTGVLAEDQYLPFAPSARGFLLGEGSCVLLLETLEHALARNSRIYCEIKGYAMTTDSSVGAADLSGPEELAACMQMALDEAGPGAQPDLLMADGAASVPADADERAALAGLRLGVGDRCLITVPKAVVGELYAAGAPIQAAAAALSLQRQIAWPLATAKQTAVSVPHLAEPAAADIGCILVNSRGIGGLNASLALTRYEH